MGKKVATLVEINIWGKTEASALDNLYCCLLIFHKNRQDKQMCGSSIIQHWLSYAGY